MEARGGGKGFVKVGVTGGGEKEERSCRTERKPNCR